MTRPPLATSIASLLGVLITFPANAGTGVQASVQTTTVSRTVQGAAEREAVRRYNRSESVGRDAVAAGDRAMAEKDFETAYSHYKLGCDNIPLAPKSDGLYKRCLKGMSDAAVSLAEQRIAEGRYADAEFVLKQVLDERYNPHCKDAVVMLSRLETPGYYNKTITPKFRASIEEVKQKMIDAEGYFQSGRYDMAFKRCEQILNIDPYNIAARKMEEKINEARDHYATSAYNEARSRAIWKIDQAWGLPVRKFGLEGGGVVLQPISDSAGTAAIKAKLNRIIIPRLEFREATIREAVDFLKKKSVELDVMETDPAKRGVNIVLKLENAVGMAAPIAAAADPLAGMAAIPGLEPIPNAVAAPVAPVAVSTSGSPITLNLSNIPLLEALNYVTQLANLKYKIEPYAVSIVPLGTPVADLIGKEYKVRPSFITSKVAGAGGDALAAGAAGDATHGGGGSGIAGKLEARDVLTASGVSFPPGASANYIASSSTLVVRNTQENLEIIDILVRAINDAPIPAQVEIESKFVEITQNNIKELSFDWLLGAFNVGQGGVFASGGTSGNTPPTNSKDFPIVGPGNVPIGTNPVTGGNRSGSTAITASAIDALLFGATGASSLAPGIAAISGVFTDPQFQLVIRALNQKKGVDLLSAPRVTTKSGNKAIIEIIREFRYPTEFDPPQIPQTFGNTGNNNNGGGVGGGLLGGSSSSSFPVTPTTPTTFETRNTGVTLEVQPTIGPDNYTIDLELIPQVVEFEGFINYGSPIQTTSTNLLGVTSTNVITPNVINQPIFSTRKVSTSVSIFDGQTVVLGGLMREDVQKVEDKTPLLGDIPLLGRLFRSSVDQHLKRNLVIFVSARLINPAGEPVHLEEEAEEVVETLAIPEQVAPMELLPLMPK